MVRLRSEPMGKVENEGVGVVVLEDGAAREAVEGKLSGEYTGTERILALSDGVFAVAITLLVLDL